MLTPAKLADVPMDGTTAFHMIEDPAWWSAPYVRGYHLSGREIVSPAPFGGQSAAMLADDPATLTVYVV